jgi:predicted peroxiredoxin
MARLIMAGVATVDMFDGDKLFGSATTLTESSLNIGISAEDIRGGEGAGMLGRYFHTSTFELTLTDALFNLEYIAKSVGANIEDKGDVIANEQITAEKSGELTISKNAVALNGCNGKVFAWYRGTDSDVWTEAEVTSKVLKDSGIKSGNTYCVKYFYTNEAAKKIRIKSDYVPATLRLVLKENLYAAGETNSSTTKVGYILINIPRFQLDGSQELSMSMTGASTTSLKGMALISDGCNAGCEGAGYYADMVQVLDADKWYDGIIALAVDGGKVAQKADAKVYAIYNGKTPKLITDDLLADGITLVIPETTGEVKLMNGEEVIASGAIVIGE